MRAGFRLGPGVQPVRLALAGLVLVASACATKAPPPDPHHRPAESLLEVMAVLFSHICLRLVYSGNTHRERTAFSHLAFHTNRPAQQLGKLLLTMAR